MKPHKGSIAGIRLDIPGLEDHDYAKNLGYVIVGRFLGHPEFGHSTGHTSLITKKGRWKKNGTCEVETLNSRYTWVKPKDG